MGAVVSVGVVAAAAVDLLVPAHFSFFEALGFDIVEQVLFGVGD